MKLDKKDLPKVLILIGIFIIGLGIFVNAMTKKEKPKKIEWKETVLEETEEEGEPEDFPAEVEEDGGEIIDE